MPLQKRLLPTRFALLPLRNSITRLMGELMNYGRALLKTCLLISILAFGVKTTSNVTYCNDRFSFCIEYPPSFTAQGESDNGDGQVFLSKDKKAEIRAFGSLAIEDLDQLTQQYEFAVSDLKVTYKVVKSSWFIVSGTDKEGKIVYRKTIKKKLSDYMGDGPQDVFQTLMITYPADQNNIYGTYCGKIAKSLSGQ